jgi:hypothetical protein
MAGDNMLVEITCKDAAAVIHYTIDGSELNDASPVYTQPLKISSNTVVRAQALMEGYNPSNQIKVIYDFVDPDKNGITWKLYRGEFLWLPNFDKLNPVAQGKAFQFDLDEIYVPKSNFALQLESFIQIDKDGQYEFSTSSNDGSKLYIDNKLVVDNDGEHGPRQISGSLYLTKGRHSIRATYFQSGGSKTLIVFYGSDEISYQSIPGSVLFKTKN